MANKKHLALLKQGVGAWNAWRRMNPRVRPNLSGASLFGATLCGANLRGADPSQADLRGADLFWASLDDANLTRASLSYQPVDEVVVLSRRWSQPVLKTIRAGPALFSTKTARRAAVVAPSVVESRTSKHQPRATASFGVPAPINRRMRSPRLYPATWIR